MQTLAGLSALTRLRLGSNEYSSIVMPFCKELASLQSTSIKDLTMFLRKVHEVGAGAAAVDNSIKYLVCMPKEQGTRHQLPAWLGLFCNPALI